MPATDHEWSDGLLEAGLGDAEVAAVVGWTARVRRMVEVEAALGRALAGAGVIPDGAGDAITRACDPERLDLDVLARRAARSATPVIPLVAALAEQAEPLAAAWLHHGATSQDVVDTATVLQLREALALLDRRLADAADHAAELARRHRDTVMAGRTLGQQAVPTTFGLLAARWLGALARRREQLAVLRTRVLVVQLGGSVGTRAVWADRADAVVEALAGELQLAVPDLPWHAERDRIAELAGALSAVAAVVGTVATDLVLLAQSELGEVAEGAGEGPGSSAMPHKRNPVHATAARAAARLAQGECSLLLQATAGHELERAAGAWQAEWVALPSALVRTTGAVTRLGAALQGLEVDPARMRANLAANLGLTGSEALATVLSPALGRVDAQALVGELAARAATQRRALAEVAAQDERVRAVLALDELTAALDPTAVVAQVAPLVDRALAAYARPRPTPEVP
ncbi:lyase family protein [Egicoccus halophilus]|uniref:3-carboxy-cis,cis-muconate cycloisomerase n=1 Tax=Egicoccus halophilus TaxID=1670830 RepID=A0A8J3A7U8_9ACTN|nr:lyase family protein [Egicoccus halophilus]GGI04135.1 3-carboxy-cis,cis-muconate cycloisomerase [Egicoccus halophilus]